MDFVHQPYQPGETIAAIATPPGEGGVAIIRISGKEALVVASKIFSGAVLKYASHTAHYGHVLNLKGERIDDALIIPFLGTRSYTGEDTVEIHCHGGTLITRRVLDAAIAAGARAAKPGEFTFKAFINGKIDLAQAEAVQELICAKNEHALDAAEGQLEGSLSKKITDYQDRLTLIAAILEAWVDFPEEGLEFTTMDELSENLRSIVSDMKQLERTFHNGRIIHDGISLCLVGSPNVGKSSLMNALLDKERAIVSDIPGTTRDILEDQMRLSGLNLRLLDTAGIRHSEEVIEQEGIRRTKEAMAQSDLILFVLDASLGIREEEERLLEQLPSSKTIIIWNKIDLTSNLSELNFPHVVSLSAKERVGLDRLQQKIDEVIWSEGPPAREEVMITNVRHKKALDNAITSAETVIEGLKTGVSPEFLTLDMRNSLTQLGTIIGTNISEDILSSIFSTFCIGK